MKNKTILILVFIVIIVLSAGGYFGYRYWQQSTPQYSLTQIQEAIANHDTTAFNKYFDAESVFDNMWPRARTEYATYYAQTQSNLQQSINLAALDNQSSTYKQSFETQLYDFVLGKSGGSKSETSKSFLQEMLATKPQINIQNGIASFGFIYENYAQQNPQNYPVYKLNVLMQQQPDHRWKITDVQGVEDLFTTSLADTIRLNAIQNIIPSLANAYIIAGQQPYLTNDNWQTVLANFAVQQNATTTLPEDPLSSYGNTYAFAIINGNSLKNFEYVIKANLSSVTDMGNSDWNGISYGEMLKDFSGGTNTVLGLDCTPPAFCQFYWGNDSAWMQMLKNDTSTTTQ